MDGGKKTLIWITGASRGIGQALVATVPWPNARVIGVSRGRGKAVFNLVADLSGPSGWQALDISFRDELSQFRGERIICLHAAATIDPVGWTGETSQSLYWSNVLLNATAPLIVGAAFLEAVRQLSCHRQLVLLSSGAADRVYAGLAPYAAGKAAVNQWVRTVGAEQARRGGVQVLAVTPGRVATTMHQRLRAASDDQFPEHAEFTRLHREGQLSDPLAVAGALWSLVCDEKIATGSVIDLRDCPDAEPGATLPSR